MIGRELSAVALEALFLTLPNAPERPICASLNTLMLRIDNGKDEAGRAALDDGARNSAGY